MKKLIVILTLCIFTSLAVATPASAANVVPCDKNTKTIIMSTNIDDALAQLNKSLAGKQIDAANLNIIKNNCITNSTAKLSAAKLSAAKISAAKLCAAKLSAAKLSAAKKCAAKKNTTKKSTKKASTTKPSTTTPSTTKPSTTAPSTTKPSTTTPSTTTPSTSNYRTFQKSVIDLVNKERTSRGLNALAENSELDKVATLKSEDMAKLGYFDHTSPTYGSPFDMLAQFGIKYTAAGENIAYGQSTPEEVMTGWMNSQGHRENILRTSFTQIGVGIAKKANGQLVWTQTFDRP